MNRLVSSRCPDDVIGRVAPTTGLTVRRASIAATVSLIGWALLLSACASTPPQAVTPGPFVPLADDEAFLVVHIDTAYGVEKIDAGRIPIARDLQPGSYLWLVRVDAGRYRWSAVRLAAQSIGSDTLRLKATSETKEREFEFTVEPGKLNYPGHLVIEPISEGDSIASGVEIRNRNHSAMAVRALLASHPELLAAHPIHYAGTSEDGFLDFYTRERDRVRRSEPKRAARPEEVR